MRNTRAREKIKFLEINEKIIMQQVYEHIREDEDLMIDFLKIIREIENAGDSSRHPDTRNEKKTEMKVEIIEMLVDIGMHGDRRDWLDKHRLPLYELAQKSDQFKKELANYLITFDTIPHIGRYPPDDEDEDLFRYIEEQENSLQLSLFLARCWFYYRLCSCNLLSKWYLDILKNGKNPFI